MDFNWAVIPPWVSILNMQMFTWHEEDKKSIIDYCRLLVPPLLTELKLSLLLVGDSWVIPMGSLFSLDKTSLRCRHDEAWKTKSSFLKYRPRSSSFSALRFFYINSPSPYKCPILQHFRYHDVCVNEPEYVLPKSERV